MFIFIIILLSFKYLRLATDRPPKVLEESEEEEEDEEEELTPEEKGNIQLY